jgi:hypothetical protein
MSVCLQPTLGSQEDSVADILPVFVILDTRVFAGRSGSLPTDTGDDRHGV